MSNDKFIERDRYDQRASNLDELSDKFYLFHGAQSIDLPLRRPYAEYEEFLLSQLNLSSKVLELGSGIGAFTGVLLRSGAAVFATDISPNSLKVLHARYKDSGRLVTQVADMECLPFQDEHFDFVTCAGSLSYGDNVIVMNEIFRVLKPGGLFVCVDSLNHNLIYRFNRWVHFLRGQRTRSTLIRMPTEDMIERYRVRFGKVETRFFGAFTWAVPVLVFIFGKEIAAKLSDFLDDFINVHKSAFKFLLIARKSY